MKNQKSYIFPIIIVLLSVASPMAKNSSKNIEFNYFLGYSEILNRRYITRKLDAINVETTSEITPLHSRTFSLGRSYHPVKWFQIQLSAEYGFAKNLENSEINKYIDSVTVHYRHGGVGLDFQLKAYFSESFAFVAGIGGVANISGYRTEDANNIKVRKFSPKASFEIGTDIVVSRKVGFSFGYKYLLWKPVSFLDARNLPLDPILYSEFFHSHSLFIRLNFGRK